MAADLNTSSSLNNISYCKVEFCVPFENKMQLFVYLFCFMVCDQTLLCSMSFVIMRAIFMQGFLLLPQIKRIMLFMIIFNVK